MKDEDSVEIVHRETGGEVVVPSPYDEYVHNEDGKHLTPRQGVTAEVPEGEWVDVPAGMVVLHGTYVDEAGVLRASKDGSVVAAHNKTCGIKGLTPEELVQDDRGVNWCPTCYFANENRKEMARLNTLFKNPATGYSVDETGVQRDSEGRRKPQKWDR